MHRLKYDPSTLVLQLVDASGARQISMALDHLADILAEAGRVDSMRGVQVRGVEADPSELCDLVEGSRMIAMAGFSQRTLFTTGQGLRRQEVEELLKAFTRIEIGLSEPLRTELALFPPKVAGETEALLATWLNTIEYCARVKQAWQLPAEIVVRVPQGAVAVELGMRLDRLAGRAAFQVQASADSAAFTLDQQQAQYGMKLCEEPYRVITFSASGHLTGCSGDQRQRIYFGSLEAESLRGLWEGGAMESWRRTRAESQCQGCPGLGTTLRRPALISVYDAIGEQRFHEYPQQQLRRIAEEDESKPAAERRDVFFRPRKAS